MSALKTRLPERSDNRSRPRTHDESYAHQQFGEVWIPPAVDGELQRIPQDAVAELVIDAKRSGWLKIRPVSNAPLIRLLAVELHSGEAEAIALALEMNAERLLIDTRETDASLPVSSD